MFMFYNIPLFSVKSAFYIKFYILHFTFKSYVLFGIHTLLDKSFRVLQLPAHLSNNNKWIVVKF